MSMSSLEILFWGIALHKHICVYIYIYIHISTHICVDIYMCVYIYIQCEEPFSKTQYANLGLTFETLFLFVLTLIAFWKRDLNLQPDLGSTNAIGSLDNLSVKMQALA